MLNPGTFLADRYEIIERVGAGGMSDVYRATDHILERDVAVKVLKSEFAEDAGFVSKFRAEAQSAAGLEHPNIVNIYDVGSEDGMYYIVMEYVEGITLKTYIEKKGHLNYKEVISIAIQVGRGIEAAHNKGIIHRDIKPQNIIISHEGKVKVTDFGIARAASSNTMSADVMGSVHYSSPEQARNGYVTAQSDIYSLGIVMYEMATGVVPFDGETAVQIAIQHLQGEMTPPSKLIEDIPVSIEKIILKATQKSPERRYSDMGELLVDLKKALVNPDEDFVTMAPAIDENGKTRVISQEELEELREVAAPKEAPKEDKIKNILDEEDEDEYADDYDDEDDDVNPKMEKAITIMGIAAAAIIGIIAIYLIGSFLGWFHFGSGSSKKEDTKTEATKEDTEDEEKEEGNIEVPDLLGMTEDEAAEALKKQNLGYKVIGTESSSKYAEGQVCNQSPKSGKKVTENSTVKITISSGEGSKSIPNVIGATEADATNSLQAAGYKVNVSYGHSSTVAAGQVISQSPDSSQKGQAGDTITISVSQGPDEIDMPNVVGSTKDAAVAELQSKGFTVTINEEDKLEAAGTVVGQNPVAGTKLSSGSAVIIAISTGHVQVTAPDVRGMDPATAVATLRAAGFNGEIKQEPREGEYGKVVSTTVTPPGTQFPSNTGITIYVGNTPPVVNPTPPVKDPSGSSPTPPESQTPQGGNNP